MIDYLDSLSRLVALDTVSPIDDEQLERCAAELSRYGCRPVGDRLFAFGDPAAPVWLYGHLDTKPIGSRTAWNTEPLTLTERDGMLYGLGVSDSKFQLLNALSVADPARHFVLIDTSEETDGAPGAAAFVARHLPATLLICDGARGDADLYAGYSGQADGVFHLRTGRATHHPARPGGDAADLLRALLVAVAGCPRFTLTGITAPHTERSLAVQEIDVRFDIRYGPDEEPAVDALLEAWPHTSRQSMAPVAGARAISVPGLVTGGLAPFSNRLGQLGPLKVDRLVVVPGAEPDNRNHQPNEFIHIGQIEHHQDVLRRVLDALETEGNGHE
ncbi:M20/M25/M40 family metallo-hydrolase [Microbispora sp. RL4-1S]|uniref:M20/M25/M40 family metallo-hydrolase n=1 Tax=Microbispora oryzae TaxID=2806554 RepID=A0A940WLD6_9ACTN|nr:M20/M25/M40 family metallo-hydrolase [Microbispora oryzae]MBP2707794.1 M20/M25/M40 family metallo-hydrolase [Microbispora oryzae]